MFSICFPFRFLWFRGVSRRFGALFSAQAGFDDAETRQMFEELDRSDRALRLKPVREELSGKLALVQQLLGAIKASKSGAPWWSRGGAAISGPHRVDLQLDADLGPARAALWSEPVAHTPLGRQHGHREAHEAGGWPKVLGRSG